MLRELVKVAEDTGTKIAVENTMQPALLDLIFCTFNPITLGSVMIHLMIFSIAPNRVNCWSDGAIASW